MTTKYTVRRYQDNQAIGSVELTDKQFAKYKRISQQPQGVIVLGDLMDGMCTGNEYDIFDLDHDGQDTSVDVYLD